jgi:hypothetical protein
MATTPRYPKVSTQNLVRSPGFDFDVPSPLSQAVSRRLVEQEQADAKQADMNLSPLDKAVSALKATASMGTMLFQAIQQAPKALQGEDAYTEAIGNTAYIPEDPKALEYMGDFGNMLEKLETEYKIPALMPELIPFQPLANLAVSQAGRGVAQGATRAGMAAERALDQPVTDIMNRGGRGAGLLSSFSTNPAQVVKPKGGNWEAGAVEKALRPMKRNETAAKSLEEMRSVYPPEVLETLSPETRETVTRAFPHLEKEVALNNWVDRNLTNYVKKEMGTPEDPVRRLAEEGISHIPAEDLRNEANWLPERLEDIRRKQGFPGAGMANSPEAQGWEIKTDTAIEPTDVGAMRNLSHLFKKDITEPWMANAPDETKVYMANDDLHGGYLGFDHIMDVLRQDVAAGRIRPDQLSKVSMEQAVRRTYEFDQEMARKMVEAQIKATEGMPVHKEYPEGYKWIELTQPKELPAGMKETVDKRYLRNEAGELVEDPRYRSLEDALKYEGDTMGHCVGGYCPDVAKGKSRIYSLRDKKGEPHVTVEVNPIATQKAIGNLPRPEREALAKSVKDQYFGGVMPGASSEDKYWELLDKAYIDKYGEPQPSIKQIKGKQNAAPKEDYLPYVQDFVRSGEWSDVGDFKNTGLMRAEDVKKAGWDMGDIDQKYLTKQEYDDLLLKQLGNPPPEGMKAGGRVGFTDNPDSMMMELEDQKFQVGGIVDVAARAAKAAKAAQMKKAMKASEALAKIEGKRLNITQADRTKVGQGYLGGPGFSGLQLQEGPHKDVGAVWGVKNTGTAKTIVGGFDKPLGKEYFTTMIGSPTQHQSNQMVFDKLYGDFKREAKKGNLDPELKDKINARLAAAVDKEGNPVFPPDVDILDKDFKKIVNTFDRRAVTGNLLGGVGVGGKKGQIIDYDKVIRDTTDPFLLDAPSGSMGYRLWTPSGEIIERPDLHPAFPAILTGEDLGVEFSPAAQDILMSPWIENVRETKGRNPGYMDWTRGRPPSVEVTDKLLRNLEESGNKKGGLIKIKRKAGGGIVSKAAKEALERMKPAKAEMAARGALWDKKMAEDSSKYLREVEPFDPSNQEVQDKIKRMQDVKKAIGGAINADDLILTERPL